LTKVFVDKIQKSKRLCSFVKTKFHVDINV